MTPGDVADAAGNLWIKWWAPGSDGALSPDGVIKAGHGRVWVTPDQAANARKFGWRAVQATTGLVTVERAEAEARSILADPVKA